MDDDIIDTSPRGLRQAARRGTRLEAENRELRRELEMRKALGDVVDSPFGKMFSAAFDGEADVDAIREAWKDYSDSAAQTFGFTPQGGTPDPVLTDDDLTSTRERQNLAHGAASDVPPASPGGKVLAQKAFARALDADMPDDEARAVAFHALVSAAAGGDQSVILGRQGQR